MRIALVHDYLVQYGGAERVLEAFCEIFPNAPIYTLIHDDKLTHGRFSKKKVRTSFLQHVPFSKTRHRIFPPLMPMAIEQFDFSNFDVVLSDSSSFAKGVITGPDTLNICYMHTPMRFAWDDCQKYTEEFYFPRCVKKIVPFFMNYIRIWDRISAERPDRIIANSKFISRRIKKYYKRDSTVIEPPVEVDRFFISDRKDDFFLAAGRHMSYKKFDIVVAAFNRLGLKLKVLGRGPETEKLRSMAGPNIEFLGRVSDEELSRYFSKSLALIFPQEEDFGITAIEALASGTPLIAFRGGDIPEHIEPGKTGVLFDEQTPEAIAKCVSGFDPKSFDPTYIRQTAVKFDKSLFKAKIKEYIDEEYKKFKKKRISEGR